MGEGLSASVWIAAEVGIRWNETYALQVATSTEKANVNHRAGNHPNAAGGSEVTHLQREVTTSNDSDFRTPGGTGIKAHIGRLANRKADAWLFPNSDGGLMRGNNWRIRNWLSALKAAGLDKIKPTIGFHDLRRLATARMFADGTNLRTIIRRLGQKTATLAAEVYAQPDANRRPGTSGAYGDSFSVHCRT